METAKSQTASSSNESHITNFNQVTNFKITNNVANNSEFVHKLNELLEWQREQEEQVKLAEQFSRKLREQLEKADIKEFQYKSVDELVTTDYSNEDIETGEPDEKSDGEKSNQNKGKFANLFPLFSISVVLLAIRQFTYCRVNARANIMIRLFARSRLQDSNF